jgi:predicted RNase H-like HicB family nuclease
MKAHVIKEKIGYSASIQELGVFAQGDTWEEMLVSLNAGITLTDEYKQNRISELKQEFELVL